MGIRWSPKAAGSTGLGTSAALPPPLLPRNRAGTEGRDAFPRPRGRTRQPSAPGLRHAPRPGGQRAAREPSPVPFPITSSSSFSSGASSPFLMCTIAPASLTVILPLWNAKKEKMCFCQKRRLKAETRTLSRPPRKRRPSFPCLLLRVPAGCRLAELLRAGGLRVGPAPRASLAEPRGRGARGGSKSLQLEQPRREKPS